MPSSAGVTNAIKNVDSIKAIAVQAGVRFVHANNPKQCKQNNTLYLLTPNARFNWNAYCKHHQMDPKRLGYQCDGILIYKNLMRAISWKHTSKAMVCKYLADPGNTEICGICMEDPDFGLSSNCSQCHFVMCSVCLFKMAVGESPMSNPPELSEYTPFQCPVCNQKGEPMMSIIQDRYHQLFDRLHLFTAEQKELLMGFKAMDPLFEKRMKQWKQVSAIKKGTNIIILGLKSRPELNGETAEIIGEKVSKNGVGRWPIKLVDKTNPSAATTFMLKRETLRKIGNPNLKSSALW